MSDNTDETGNGGLIKNLHVHARAHTRTREYAHTRTHTEERFQIPQQHRWRFRSSQMLCCADW